MSQNPFYYVIFYTSETNNIYCSRHIDHSPNVFHIINTFRDFFPLLNNRSGKRFGTMR